MQLQRNNWEVGELLALNPENGARMRFCLFNARSPWKTKHAILAGIYGIVGIPKYLRKPRVSVHPFYVVTGDTDEAS